MVHIAQTWKSIALHDGNVKSFSTINYNKEEQEDICVK